MDLSDRLGQALGDRGLTTCTIHPEFADNGLIYLGYVFDDDQSNPGGVKKNRISRFKLVGDKIDRESEQVILGSCAIMNTQGKDPNQGEGVLYARSCCLLHEVG